MLMLQRNPTDSLRAADASKNLLKVTTAKCLSQHRARHGSEKQYFSKPFFALHAEHDYLHVLQRTLKMYIFAWKNNKKCASTFLFHDRQKLTFGDLFLTISAGAHKNAENRSPAQDPMIIASTRSGPHEKNHTHRMPAGAPLHTSSVRIEA